MALSPDDIERRTFAVTPHGYDVDEVRAFLFEVAASARLARFSTQPPPAPPVAPSHKADAPRWPERPRTGAGPDAPEVVDPGIQAESDARDVVRKANADAASLHEQAKRVLATAQDQANAIVEEAEHTAREIVSSAAEGHAEAHMNASSDRARRHADEVLRAERNALERLRAAQSDVGAAIDRIARADTRPVVDLRHDVGDLRFGISDPGPNRADPFRPPGTVGPTGSATASDVRAREPALTRHLIDTGDPSDVAEGDPTVALMRNAVTRAILAATEARSAGSADAPAPTAPGDGTRPGTSRGGRTRP